MSWRGTPGPWKAERNLGCKRITAKVGAQHKQAKRTEVACTPGLHDEVEDQANADGIAAVPQLVEALLLLRDQVDYRNGACRLNEPVGGVLPTFVLDKVDEALRTARVLP